MFGTGTMRMHSAPGLARSSDIRRSSSGSMRIDADEIAEAIRMQGDGALRERELAANRAVGELGAERGSHLRVEAAAFGDQHRIDADGVHGGDRPRR